MYINEIYDNVKVGDKVVIDTPNWYSEEKILRIEEVIKVTATQITVASGIRFKKSDGWQTPKVYDQARIKTSWASGKGESLMTVEQAEARNREIKQKQRGKALVNEVFNRLREGVAYDVLLKLAEVLEIETGEDSNG